MKLILGEGRNNFIVEWNENREEELKDEIATLNDTTE
jgi:segregation and condensation protein A